MCVISLWGAEAGRRKTEDGILSPQFPNLRFFYIDVGYRIYRICGYRRSTDVRARTSNFDGKGLRFEMFDVGKGQFNWQFEEVRRPVASTKVM